MATETVDTTEAAEAGKARRLANLRPPWKPGENPGGASVGGHQTARWRKAINAAVTEDDCAEVIQAMKASACGVEVLQLDKKTGETRVYSRPPDAGAARLFFEVLKVIGPDAGQVDLSNAPVEVLEWLAANGTGN